MKISAWGDDIARHQLVALTALDIDPLSVISDEDIAQIPRPYSPLRCTRNLLLRRVRRRNLRRMMMKR